VQKHGYSAPRPRAATGPAGIGEMLGLPAHRPSRGAGQARSSTIASSYSTRTRCGRCPRSATEMAAGVPSVASPHARADMPQMQIARRARRERVDDGSARSNDQPPILPRGCRTCLMGRYAEFAQLALNRAASSRSGGRPRFLDHHQTASISFLAQQRHVPSNQGCMAEIGLCKPASARSR